MWSVVVTIGGILLCIAMLLLFVILVLFSVDTIKDQLIDLGWLHNPNEDEEE